MRRVRVKHKKINSLNRRLRLSLRKEAIVLNSNLAK
jgi:hypothetical protein